MSDELEEYMEYWQSLESLSDFFHAVRYGSGPPAFRSEFIELREALTRFDSLMWGAWKSA
jgi:hypothetical protein